jgi:hypothetical protein
VSSPEKLNVVEFTHVMGRLFKRLRSERTLNTIPSSPKPSTVLSPQVCCLIYAYRLGALYDIGPANFETPTNFFEDVAAHLKAPKSAEQTGKP